MKKRSIRVWATLVVAILALTLWCGYQLGSLAARYWFLHHSLEAGTLPPQEQKHLQAEFDELALVQTLRFFALKAPDERLKRKFLLNEIKEFESLRQRPYAPELKPLVDLNLGLAYVQAAVQEEKSNDEAQSKKHMQSAQLLFKSLGWHDYSNETLKAIAKRELNEWPYLQTKAAVK